MALVSDRVVDADFDTTVNADLHWPYNWVNWWLTSESILRDAESKILQNLKAEYITQYINIGPVVGDKDINVWTLSMKENGKGIPLVLLHGLCSGLALWALCYDELSRRTKCPIYAIDIPGFGRSSRPSFSSDSHEVEQELVEILEAWRTKMKLEKMILVGHSFAGYLSYSYSIKYPSRISHLICAEPWGFNNKPADLADITRIPFHHRMAAKVMDCYTVRPMGPVRLLAIFGGGHRAIKLLRGKDLIRHFKPFVDDPQSTITNYIFHCNAQNPTGESAFVSMMSTYGWAKNPMNLRIDSLDPNIPLTIIYGSRSWIDHYPLEAIVRRRSPSFVDYHILDSGHHVYSETAMEFSEIVIKVSSQTNGQPS